MNQTTEIANRVSTLAPIEHNGIRVITLALMDELHGRPANTAGRTFHKHRKKLNEGEDYWELSPSEFGSTLNVEPKRGGNRLNVIVLSESGYCMLVKSFRDPLAWDVQRALVNHYFKPAAKKNVLESILERLESVCVSQVSRSNALESRVETGFLEVNSKLEELSGCVRAIQKRRDLSAETKRQHTETILRFYQGRCPCCDAAKIYDAKGERLPGHNWEHWEGRTKNKPHQTWATCQKCNNDLEGSHDFRVRKRPMFDSYQQRRSQDNEPLFTDLL